HLPSFRGKLDRVGKQIDYYLLYARSIRMEAHGGVRRRNLQLDTASLGLRLDDAHALLHCRFEPKIGFLQLKSAGLDLRQIQQTSYHTEKMLCRFRDVSGIYSITRDVVSKYLVSYNLRKSYNCVQRRP